MKNLAFVSDLIARDPARCAQSLPVKGSLVPFRQCSNPGTIMATLPGDPRVLPFCGTHAKAPNVTILSTGPLGDTIRSILTSACHCGAQAEIGGAAMDPICGSCFDAWQAAGEPEQCPIHTCNAAEPIPCDGCEYHDHRASDICDCDRCDRCHRWRVCDTCGVCVRCAGVHGTFELPIPQ